MDPKQVDTVLALDETGRAAAWVKNHGNSEGTGLVQIDILIKIPNANAPPTKKMPPE